MKERKQEAAEKRRGQLQRSLPPNVVVVDNLKDYKDAVCDPSQKLVAVRFHATWCKACKAVAPAFYRAAAKRPDVRFVDVPVSESNAALHQGLGVPSLPYAHIYDPKSASSSSGGPSGGGGLVEELKLTRRCVKSFEKRLDSYLNGYCDLSDEGDFRATEN